MSKFKLVFGLTITIASLWMLHDVGGWMLIGGVFLFTWGNNIGMNINK